MTIPAFALASAFAAKGVFTTQHVNKRGYNRFLEMSRGAEVSISEEKIAEGGRRDGLKGRIANTDMSAGKVIAETTDYGWWNAPSESQKARLICAQCFISQRNALRLMPVSASSHTRCTRSRSVSTLRLTKFDLGGALTKSVQGQSLMVFLCYAKTVPVCVITVFKITTGGKQLPLANKLPPPAGASWYNKNLSSLNDCDYASSWLAMQQNQILMDSDSAAKVMIIFINAKCFEDFLCFFLVFCLFKQSPRKRNRCVHAASTASAS